MTSQGDLPVTFHKSAVRFDVAESDYLLLQSLGIATANSFAFRVPKADDLETFLQEKLLNACAYKNEDGVILTFNKNPPDRWVDWKLSEDAAALRRLWQFSREVAKSEVEKMVGGEDTSKKIGITEMMAMESSAVDRGMPHPSSDRQRPSLYTMNRVAKALQSPGATYEIVAWECFISREEEERLVRAGKMPKAKQTELVLGKDSTVLAKDKHSDYVPDVKVGDMEKLREALDLRARSMELLDLARFNTVRALNDAYLAELTKTVPSGMTFPTLNELRRLDREIFLEMGRHLSRGRGTLEDAIRFYADHKDAMIWRLVEPVPASLPDQGIDLGDQEHKDAKKAEQEAAKKRKLDDEKKEDPNKGKVCLICNKRHTPLCKIPPGWRKEQREAAKKAKRDKAAAARGGSDFAKKAS